MSEAVVESAATRGPAAPSGEVEALNQDNVPAPVDASADAATTMTTSEPVTGSATEGVAAAKPAEATGRPGRGSALHGVPSTAAQPAPVGSDAEAKGPGARPASRAAPAAAVPSAPSAPAVTKSLVTLGNIGDYSGIVGSIMKSGTSAAQVVARYVNDNGGLNGHPIRVIVADAAGDPARALSLTRDLVETKSVVAFMGNLWPLSATGPRTYLEQKQIPVIGGDVAGTVWSQSPMYFPQATSFKTFAVGAMKLAVDAGKKKIGVLFCTEVEACKIWRENAHSRQGEVGAQVVYQAQVSLAQPDFTAECLQAQRAGAEAVLLGLDSTALSRFARSCLQQGYRPMMLTASVSTTSAAAKDPNLEGLLAPLGTFPFPAGDLPAVKVYHETMAKYAPGIDHGPPTSAVWAAGMLLVDAGRSLPDQVTPADFLAGLWRIKNNTLGGLTPPLTFIENQPAPDTRCFFVQKVSGGRYVAPQGSEQTCI